MTFLMFGFELGSKLGYFQKSLEKLGSFWATFDINLGSLFWSDLATLVPFLLGSFSKSRKQAPIGALVSWKTVGVIH